MNKEYYNFIEDEEELKWFFENVLQKPKVHQSYTICLSARNKQLNEEERKLYNLNKGQMINTTLLKAKGIEQNWNYELFYSKIAEFECNKRGILCKSNLPFPEKCLVVYICLKLADENDCIKKSIDLYHDVQQEIVSKIQNGNILDFTEQLYKLTGYNQHHLRLHANCVSEKPYMDLDIDVDRENIEDETAFEQEVRNGVNDFFGKGNCFIVKTSGGYHILVKKSAIKKNPNDFLKTLDKYEFIKEKIINTNQFIPIPGTLQYGNLVRVINKMDTI